MGSIVGKLKKTCEVCEGYGATVESGFCYVCDGKGKIWKKFRWIRSSDRYTAIK